MSLPTIEPLPDENTPLPPARRRRQRRMVVPPDSSDRADFLRELSRKCMPSFDFFLFSLLSGLTLGAALLLDSPPLIVLAALVAPFMAPAVGISLGTITGAGGFIFQSLGSLGIGSLIVFLCGSLAGLAVELLPAQTYQQAQFYSQFTWPGLVVLVLGAGLTTYLVARSPNQKPLVASVAVAYGLYLPAGAAGFGLSSGLGESLASGGLNLYMVHLLWAALAGAVVLFFFGIRPLNASGYLLTGIYAAAGIAALFILHNSSILTVPPTHQPATEVAGAVATASPSFTPAPTMTVTPSPVPPTSTSTRTLVPSRTPTMTVSPVPTPIWARIYAEGGDGALIREEPNYDSPIVQSILNDSLVQILPDGEENGAEGWVRILTINGKEGWIVQTLLRTATPSP